MRISDWSSDVCSSDLTIPACRNPPDMTQHDTLDRTAVVILLLCCACWGLSQIAIKIANAGISPVLQAGLRSIGAAVLLLAWCRLRRIPLFNRDGTLWWGIAAGLLFPLDFVLIYWGLSYTTASRD